MGMSDTQFKAFLRFLLTDLKEAEAKGSDEERIEKIKEIIENIQKSIED